MINIEKFKPNLIPNWPKGTQKNIGVTIEKNGGCDKYLAFFKKDGCRMQVNPNALKSRSMKPIQSNSVNERFSPLIDFCNRNNIAIDGEFYSHNMSFSEIVRFFKNEDVTRPKERKKLENYNKQFVVAFDEDGDPIYSKLKDYAKYKDKGLKTRLELEYPNRTIDWLCRFHDDLKFWLFDGVVLDRPDLVGFEERMVEITKRLLYDRKVSPLTNIIVLPSIHRFSSIEELYSMYDDALAVNYEGLVLVHKDHEYKMGRTTLNVGTILKMKDDENEFDGVVLDVEEGTIVKEGAEKTTNELGRSVTSKKKEDRIPSGMAKGFKVMFEGKSGTVSLQGFDNAAKKELLENKDKYIGRHLIYTGMHCVKDFPRSAFFKCWRDEK